MYTYYDLKIIVELNLVEFHKGSVELETFTWKIFLTVNPGTLK